MALDYQTRYPAQTVADGAYPQGKARNIALSGDGTGTPWTADLVNDIFGLLQALLAGAGITPSGTPDSGTVSQYFQSIEAVIVRRLAAVNWRVGDEFDLGGALTPGRPAGGINTSVGSDQSAWIAPGNSNGVQGTLLYSLDGRTWDAKANAKDRDLFAAVYDPTNDSWIVAGEPDGVDAYLLNASNPDGAWTEQTNPKNFQISALATDGAGTVVGAGPHDGGDVYAIRSVDGGTVWTESTMTGAAGSFISDIAWGGPAGSEVFVAVGGDGAAGPMIQRSAAGAVWTTETPDVANSATLTGVSWDGNVFIAVGGNGEVQTSPDGITWTSTRNPAGGTDFITLAGVASDSTYGISVITTNTHLLISTDSGVTWARVQHPPTYPTGSSGWNKVAHDGNAFLLVDTSDNGVVAAFSLSTG